MKNALADKLPYWHLHEDYMVFKDGSLGAGFKIQGLDISSASDGVINSIAQKIENLFVSSEEGLKFQLFYKLTPDVMPLIQGHKLASANAEKLYHEVSASRFEMLS